MESLSVAALLLVKGLSEGIRRRDALNTVYLPRMVRRCVGVQLRPTRIPIRVQSQRRDLFQSAFKGVKAMVVMVLRPRRDKVQSY